MFRTHNCGVLNAKNVGLSVKLAGWIHNKRDHGGILFIDLRDNFGLTQIVIENEDIQSTVSNLKLESVIFVDGLVRMRPDGTANKALSTGEIEVLVSKVHIESEANQIPFQINFDDGCNEETRLTYRFLDLRRETLHKNILLRSKIISFIRKRMEQEGFVEFQTPILTASSPEGARDFLVPSRLHPGKFYALPQAPQQFKQLLMVSGFDKYFQIAPCFRDEDARADRSPGEFYQLDVEMSFVTQEDVFGAIEPVIYDTFASFSNGKHVSAKPFVRVKYEDSMEYYGSDKPDLRNPITNCNVTEFFANSDFSIFAKAIANGSQIYAVQAPSVSTQSRKFFDDMIKFAQENGAAGLAYIIYESADDIRSPIAKFLSKEALMGIFTKCKLKYGDAVFFTCETKLKAQKLAGLVRTELGKRLALIDENRFEICWITDFPFYELNDETGQVEFSHNPFSMPQGGLGTLILTEPESFIRILQEQDGQYQVVFDKDILAKICSITSLSGAFFSLKNDGFFDKNYLFNTEDAAKDFRNNLISQIKIDPLSIKAFQYDIVCNGVELSSGAIRNHKLDIMYKAFEIAGYSKEQVNDKFAGMVKAFSYGTPPHGGIAPGIDRIVMLIAGTQSIRDIIAFPLNGKAQDLLMNAPCEVSQKQLKDVHIKFDF